MSSNLPAIKDTTELFTHFETTHNAVMAVIQRAHDACDPDTEEGRQWMTELETVAEKATAGYEDVKILKFRNSLMEQTIETMNTRQKEMLDRLDSLEEKIIHGETSSNRRAEARRKQRERDAFKTGHWAAVSARGNGRH